MIIDSFLFFQELDLLEIRLEYLYPIIDKFVIVEARQSFKGNTKDYIFEKNINRYENTVNGFFQNKLAYQIGLKSQFSINKHNFNILTEYNQAQPYTYAHKHPMQNYTHMNQALAHPLGANFKENIFMINLVVHLY